MFSSSSESVAGLWHGSPQDVLGIDSLGSVVPFVARRPASAHRSGSRVGDAAAQTTYQQRLGVGGVPLVEFAELLSLVSDAEVTDVFVNGPGEVWFDRGNGLERQGSVSFTEERLRAFAMQLIAAGGRHVDEASPCVDVRLHDGIRVHAVLPPISTSGTLLSIRLPRVRPLAVADLETAGMFDLVESSIVLHAVSERQNILITGAAGTGKTTLLSALLTSADPAERIVAVEDVAELRVDHPHFIALESRQPNLEGAGQVDLRRLVREALRMRPDRLVVGECRGAELRELLMALNTGHDGGAGTLHANSLADVPARLEALGALAGMSAIEVARQTISAIDVVIHLARQSGVRRLAQIGRFALDGEGRLAVVDESASIRPGELEENASTGSG